MEHLFQSYRTFRDKRKNKHRFYKSIVRVLQVQSTVKECNYCVIYLQSSLPFPIGAFHPIKAIHSMRT